MPNENEDKTQDIAIAEIRKDIQYLIQLSENWNKKADQMKESYNGRNSMMQKDIDAHCVRLREVEKSQAIINTIALNNQEFIKNLQTKIFSGFFVLLTLLGAIIYTALEYFNKK